MMKKGDLVILSVKGAEHFWYKKEKYVSGIVVGHCRDINLIRIKVDGYKTTHTFAKVFWDKVKNCNRFSGDQGAEFEKNEDVRQAEGS